MIHINIIHNEDRSVDYFEINNDSYGEENFYSNESKNLQEITYEEYQNFLKMKKNETDKMEGIFDSQECLLDTDKSKEVLRKFNLSESEMDENKRFILGQCNPVLFIPGLFGTKLMFTIDCKKFSSVKENLINLRLFCGNTICKSNEFEEHVFYPSLCDGPFNLCKSDKSNKYSACFGYFNQFFKKNECPQNNTTNTNNGNSSNFESICLNNDAVRITFYGATSKTLEKSECGLGAVKNILSAGTWPIDDSWINIGASEVFKRMYNRYYEMGYRTGFSMAAVPYDFRRFISTNDLFIRMFEQQIERLYNNTGKPVVIVAHSLGCLYVQQTLSQNKKLVNKIKKFISISPPFAGGTKGLNLFLHGNNEFDNKFSIFDYVIFETLLTSFGQRIAIPIWPIIYELQPNPIFAKIYKDSFYSNFKQAIEERLNLEKICFSKDCDEEFINKNSMLFNQLFSNFPKLNQKECRVTELIQSKKYKDFMFQYSKIPSLAVLSLLPCRNEMFDTISCPVIKYRETIDDDTTDYVEKYCLDAAESNNKNFYIHPCDSEKYNCTDNFLKEYFSDPYEEPEMIDLVNQFNLRYSKEFEDFKINITTYFDSREVIRDKIDRMLKHKKKLSKLNEMDIPEVDTIIVYQSNIPTNNAYIYDKDKNRDKFEKSDLLWKGGDSIVPNWSSLLVGLKWLYEKKIKNLKQKIQLVEYCSLLANKESIYKFDERNLDFEFSAISCDCYDKDYFYNFNKMSNNQCNHPSHTLDSHIIKFIESYLKDISNINYNIEKLPDSKINALYLYNSNFDYETKCNKDLKIIEDSGY